MIGETLDRYRIESKLGEGGMGVVYKAHDTQLNRAVAIKILPRDKVSDPDRKQRFVQEAKAASALNHPGIVTVHDIRSHEGTDFIVMEYVGGKTLEQTIPPKGLPCIQALRYGVEIADALAKAHSAGIIHRDLKPSNVMVTGDGRIKILDFGLAKLVEVAGGQTEARTRAASLTEAGMVVGTTAYMSPEQAQGHTLDGRSDIFSFGSVLYEMVTGRKAFDGDSHLAILAKILNDDPLAPAQVVRSVPSSVEQTILRCLRKDPARRYQTMADLKVTLEDLVVELASGPRAQAPAVPAPRWRVWAWAALVPLMLAAAYGGWRARRPAESAPALRAVPLLSLPGVTRSPSFSPDGNQIAFSWTGPSGGNPDIFVQQVGSGAPLQLTSDPRNDYSPTWSPDGRWIAFLRESEGPRRELRLVPPLGGPERRLAEIEPPGFLRDVTMAWCPDSSCVVVTDAANETAPGALFVVSLDSGEKRQLTTPPPKGILADSDPAISPDGKWLAFRRDNAPFNGEIHVLPLRADMTPGGALRSILPIARQAYGPKWMPDSTEILFTAQNALWRLRTAGAGTPERLPFVGEDGVGAVVSRPRADGKARLAYVRSFADVNIWRVDAPAPGAPPSSPPVVAIASTRRDAIAHLAPDGRNVAFTSTRSGGLEIWRSDVSGSGAVQLTSMDLIPGWPRWSPDGKQIAFHSNPDGNGDILIVPSEGGKPRNLTAHPATDTFPTFSHDGRWIYFSSNRSGPVTIWKIPASGGAAIQVTTTSSLMAIESPDGAYLYYGEGNNTDGTGPLWRMPAAGGVAVKIADGVNPTSFDVVAGGVYYLQRISGETRLQYIDRATLKATTVVRNLGNTDFGLCASPDGRTILFSRVDSTANDLMLVEGFR